MEKQIYSEQFFTSFVESLQDVCQKYLSYDKFVEVSGYISVEIDNLKKERYVLSELLQSSGNVVSESFCTKAFKTQGSGGSNPVRMTGKNKQPVCSSQENRSHRGGSNTSHQESFQPLTCFESPSASKSSKTCQSSSTQSSESHYAGSGFRSVEHTPDTKEVQVTLPANVEKCDQEDAAESVMSSDPDKVIDADMFEDDEPSTSMEGETSGEMNYFVSFVGSQQRLNKNNKPSPGTQGVVKNSVKQFRRFHFDRSGIDIDLLSTPPERLNILLMEYFRDTRKADGQLLTARTLRNAYCHIDMYLRDIGYFYSLNKDPHFQSCRDFLKKKLTEGGKSVTQKFSPVDEHDIELLFQTNQLGSHSPESLINTMWFLNSKYFAIRRPAEHLNMKWGDIHLKENEDGLEYIERPINDTFSLKVFAKPDRPDRCFVYFYKQYRDMRPKPLMDENCPFYLKYDRAQMLDFVFLPEPLSYSAFTSIWRKLVIGGGLQLSKKIF